MREEDLKMTINNVDLKWMDDKHNAQYFENCKTKSDVKKVMRRQVELEIPKGLSQAARSVAIKIRDKVVEWQMLSWDSSICNSVDDFVHNIMNIGGCNLFSHPKENIVDGGENALLYVIFDGGLGHDLFSCDGGLAREWLFRITDSDDKIHFEDYAGWALTIYPGW
jgi:hypothetical protein|tara:strand:- start:19 stop:516 length:498 start_codon:yes stop_codon:yes gene_type:complete